jgi:glycosyltransferase involved in cell wall biosynthesis
MIENMVSTIIPVYNRAAMLREAVDSVLAQTWRPIEIVIVDDGSNDGTPEAAQRLATGLPDLIRVVLQSNAGPGVARQKGFEASRGEFVQFLDSDDLLLPDKFALQIRGLREDPDAGISYGKTYTRRNGVRLSDPAQRSGERLRTLFPAMLSEPLWPTLAPLYRRSILEAIGPWPSKRHLEDWEFDAQAGAFGVKLHFCDAFIAETREHAEDRLSQLWMNDEGAMRDCADAYVQVLGHARRAGIPRDAPEMQQFARSLFWMARTAGSYGLPKEARRLFELARAQALNPGWDIRLFGALAGMLGWKLTSRIAEAMHRRLR